MTTRNRPDGEEQVPGEQRHGHSVPGYLGSSSWTRAATSGWRSSQDCANGQDGTTTSPSGRRTPSPRSPASRRCPAPPGSTGTSVCTSTSLPPPSATAVRPLAVRPGHEPGSRRGHYAPRRIGHWSIVADEPAPLAAAGSGCDWEHQYRSQGHDRDQRRPQCRGPGRSVRARGNPAARAVAGDPDHRRRQSRPRHRRRRQGRRPPGVQRQPGQRR